MNTMHSRKHTVQQKNTKDDSLSYVFMVLSCVTMLGFIFLGIGGLFSIIPNGKYVFGGCIIASAALYAIAIFISFLEKSK